MITVACSILRSAPWTATGGSPGAITALMGSEIVFVLALSLTLAALLTWLASRYGAEAARAVVGL